MRRRSWRDAAPFFAWVQREWPYDWVRLCWAVEERGGTDGG